VILKGLPLHIACFFSLKAFSGLCACLDDNMPWRGFIFFKFSCYLEAFCT
jgi:hypothetical protein